MPVRKLIRIIGPLVLAVGLFLGLTSGSSALGIYNKSSQYEIYVVFEPDQCTDVSWVPGTFCREWLTLEPNGSWSSNNRGGSVSLGWTRSDAVARKTPKGSYYMPAGVLRTYKVDRQGWVEIYPQFEGSQLREFRLQIYAESGNQTEYGSVRVMEGRGY